MQAKVSRRLGCARKGTIVCGRHAASAALAVGSLRELWVAQGAAGDLVAAARAQGWRTHLRSRAELAQLAATGNHQSVVARLAAPVAGTWREALAGLREPIMVVFDGIQDPRNLGACLRSAAAFGVSAAVRPERRSAPLTPAATRAAAGGEEFVALFAVPNLARELRAFKQHGIRVIGADAEAQLSLYDADLSGPVAWLFGSEDRGLRRLSKELCDELVRVPLFDSVRISSLNVSVACGICLAETLRQRRSRKSGNLSR